MCTIWNIYQVQHDLHDLLADLQRLCLLGLRLGCPCLCGGCRRFVLRTRSRLRRRCCRLLGRFRRCLWLGRLCGHFGVLARIFWTAYQKVNQNRSAILSALWPYSQDSSSYYSNSTSPPKSNPGQSKNIKYLHYLELDVSVAQLLL